MKKKSKAPKITDAKAAELAEACRMAYGSQPADDFMDRVFELLRNKRKNSEPGEQSRVE
jgi:hypothetical protein